MKVMPIYDLIPSLQPVITITILPKLHISIPWVHRNECGEIKFLSIITCILLSQSAMVIIKVISLINVEFNVLFTRVLGVWFIEICQFPLDMVFTSYRYNIHTQYTLDRRKMRAWNKNILSFDLDSLPANPIPMNDVQVMRSPEGNVYFI